MTIYPHGDILHHVVDKSLLQIENYYFSVTSNYIVEYNLLFVKRFLELNLPKILEEVIRCYTKTFPESQKRRVSQSSS